VQCRQCGAVVDSSAKFCSGCGAVLAGAVPGGMEGMLWRRGADDFATRVDEDDLPGVLKKGIIVEQGTKALLFVNGAFAEILPAGRHDIGGLGPKLRRFDPYRTGTAVLVDAGDTEFEFTITDVRTKDPLALDVTCKVVVQIENPAFFFNNVMKGRRSYLVSDLRSTLYDELQNAFNEAVGKKSVTELNWDLSLKRQFEVSVENHLRTTFQRNGYNFIQLRTIDYRFRGYDKIRGIHEEIFLLVSEEDAALQKRKRLFDVYDKDKLQDIIELTREADHHEKRIDVLQRMRRLVSSDKMNEIRTVDDFESFIHEIDKGKSLRNEEVKSLINTFAQSGLRREFLLRKIELEQEIEFENLRLVGREEIELKRFEVEAKRKRMAFDEDMKAQIDLAAAGRGIKVDDAKADAVIRRTELEGDEEELRIALDARERKLKMDAQAKRDEMEIEADRLKRLTEMGIEALITASGEEQAKLLADLKKTEILKGMTDDQILALGAKDSPELAKAFVEKFKGMPMAMLEQLTMAMQTEKDKQIKIIQEMFNKSLETQRDVAVAAAKSGGPQVVYPPPGQQGFHAGPFGGPEVIICPRCRAKVAAGHKFCTNCGNEL
jgi:hypothetical protein